MFFFIYIAIGTSICFWFVTGFLARCMLKNFVFEIRKRYGGEDYPSAKELWKQRVGKDQYRIILTGYLGLVEVEEIFITAKYRKDDRGNFLEWENKFML